MDDLVRWLGEQLDEDERIARAAIAAAGEVPGAAKWRFGNAFTDEGGTYWQITTMTPTVGETGPVELVGSGMSDGGAHEPEIARHAVQHDPARVLREIEAKRDLLRLAERAHDYHETFMNGFASALEGTLRLFALAYADRPGFREEWRP
jgi:hypothetical protein